MLLTRFRVTLRELTTSAAQNVRFGQCFICGNLADHFHVISIRMESNTLQIAAFPAATSCFFGRLHHN